MFSRRVAIAAVLVALFGAACAGRGNSTVAAGAPSSTGSTASEVTTSTTSSTTTTLPPTTEVPATTAPATTASAMTTSAAPAPASIEVLYQPHEGDSATATLTGPNGTHAKSLGDGSALFSGLPAGTYAVTITIRSAAVPESDGTGIDSALQILNGNSVHVEAGDHGVITCTDEGCVAGP